MQPFRRGFHWRVSPEDGIERLQSELALERLVTGFGIELKQHGADLPGLCPFHDDREPSLVVSPKKNLRHCLWACQTRGSVVDRVMKTRGVSFRYALELLRRGDQGFQRARRFTEPGSVVHPEPTKRAPRKNVPKAHRGAG